MSSFAVSVRWDVQHPEVTCAANVDVKSEQNVYCWLNGLRIAKFHFFLRYSFVVAIKRESEVCGELRRRRWYWRGRLTWPRRCTACRHVVQGISWLWRHRRRRRQQQDRLACRSWHWQRTWRQAVRRRPARRLLSPPLICRQSRPDSTVTPVTPATISRASHGTTVGLTDITRHSHSDLICRRLCCCWNVQVHCATFRLNGRGPSDPQSVNSFAVDSTSNLFDMRSCTR